MKKIQPQQAIIYRYQAATGGGSGSRKQGDMAPAPPSPESHEGLLRDSRWQAANKQYRCQSVGSGGPCNRTIQPSERYLRNSVIESDTVGPREKSGRNETIIRCAEGSQA